MFDIFLSYAEEDRATARKVAQSLEAVGWSVWWDRRIPTGRTWREAIESALDEMRCMVVLWSRHSIDSAWVCEEADEGRKRALLTPVLIERVEPPLGFRSIQAADLSDWDGAPDAPGLRQLLDDLEALVGKPTGAIAGSPLPGATPLPGPTPPDGLRPLPVRRPFTHWRAIVLLTAGTAVALLVASVTGPWPGRRVEEAVPQAARSPPSTPHNDADAARAPSGARGAAPSPAPDAAVAVTEPSSAAGVAPPATVAPRAATASDAIVSAPPASAPRAPSATSASRSPDASPIRSRSSAQRCAGIVERQSLGERPSADELAFLDRECR